MSCKGIEPNPDISGIGVRVAIYAQAVLTLIQPILAGLDGYISEDELTGLHELYLGILLPGCALLFSAIIQDRTFGLSVYHATIVLNLSWINNTSALIFFQFALIAQIQLDQERDFRKKVGEMWELLYGPLTSVVAREEKRAAQRQAEGAAAKGLDRSEEAKKDQEIWITAQSQAEGMRAALRSRLMNAEGLDRSKEILDEVIQNLSAFLGAGLNHSELKMIVGATNRRLRGSRLRKSLGFFDKGPRWKVRTVMEDGAKKIWGGEMVVNLLQRDWTMASLASAHLILFSAFGVWLWFTIHRFGNCEPFTNFTTLSVFVPIPVTSKHLRIGSIVIYIIGLMPFINIVVFGGLEFLVVGSCQQLIARIRKHKSLKSSTLESQELSSHKSPETGPELLSLFIVLTFLVQAYFIITTELTIHNNRHLLRQDLDIQENDWTFGQTLAIALLVLPLRQVWKEARELKVFKRLFGDPRD